MALPSQLITAFDTLKASALVAGDISKANVRFFVDTLNQSIPSSINPITYAIYRFNRTKYISNRAHFLNDIKDFVPYDAMILWTDFKDILAFFKLSGKIFLGWDKANNRYRGFILSTAASAVPSAIRILRRGETLKSSTTGESTSESTGSKSMPYLVVSEPEDRIPDTIPEDTELATVEDDMVRIYDYMQARIAQVQQRLASAEQAS